MTGAPLHHASVRPTSTPSKRTSISIPAHKNNKGAFIVLHQARQHVTSPRQTPQALAPHPPNPLYHALQIRRLPNLPQTREPATQRLFQITGHRQPTPVTPLFSTLAHRPRENPLLLLLRRKCRPSMRVRGRQSGVASNHCSTAKHVRVHD